MAFVLDYRDAIDQLTGDRALKLRAYELDNEDWGIIEDLVAILEVCRNSIQYITYTIAYRPTKTLLRSSLKTKQASWVSSQLWTHSIATSIPKRRSDTIPQS
jgi:hypothetical protein